MSTEINYAAVVEAPQARMKTVERPIPKPGPRELVVRNHAVAANPADVSTIPPQDVQLVVMNYDRSDLVS